MKVRRAQKLKSTIRLFTFLQASSGIHIDQNKELLPVLYLKFLGGPLIVLLELKLEHSLIVTDSKQLFLFLSDNYRLIEVLAHVPPVVPLYLCHVGSLPGSPNPL